MFVKLFCCKELLFINKKKEINKSNKSNVCCRNELSTKWTFNEMIVDEMIVDEMIVDEMIFDKVNGTRDLLINQNR